MRCITIRQPWATMVALGEKQYETRSWATRHRGDLAIHAGKGLDRKACQTEPVRSILAKHGYHADNLPKGAVVAVVTLVDCWTAEAGSSGGGAVLRKEAQSKGRPLSGQEKAFGDFAPGRKAWELAGVRPLQAPVPAAGRLGLWEWEPVL